MHRIEETTAPARRRVLTGAAGLTMAALTAGRARPAWAGAWPDHVIRFVVPFSPGGANDTVGRAIAEGVHKQLKQSVVVDNKPGAGAIIGAENVARSKPDGYSFLVGAIGVVTNSLLRAKMPYADDELVPVGMVAVSPSVIVAHPSVPATDLKSFAAWTKTQGAAGANFATAGTGSTPHFVAEMLKSETGAALTIVPYKSGSESVAAVMSNQVAATSEASGVVIPQIKAGKLKAIAATWSTRISSYPQIPTTADEGFPGVRIGHWAGIFAPRGTPQDIIDRMSSAIEAAMRTEEMRNLLIPQGIEPAGGSRAQFVAFIEEERTRLGKLIKASGMQVE